jgi:transposase
MTRFVGLDCSQKMTAICAIDNAGRRLWRGQCSSVPEQICDVVLRHAGDKHPPRFLQEFINHGKGGYEWVLGIETGAMTPWMVHELRNLGCSKTEERNRARQLCRLHGLQSCNHPHLLI